MRYNIEKIVRTLVNILVVLLGGLIFVLLMVITDSVMITTIVTTIVMVISVPISALVYNKTDDYLSKYWLEAHKQGKDCEREYVDKVFGWRLQHDIFETEVDVFDINGEKDTITVSELVRKELSNNPTTNDY